MVFDEGKGLSTEEQHYDPTSTINVLRREVGLWRASPEEKWSVTPETAHLGEDAKENNSTSDTYWMPGVNYLGNYGRWSFAEFTDIWEMQDKFEAELEARLSLTLEKAVGPAPTVSG